MRGSPNLQVNMHLKLPALWDRLSVRPGAVKTDAAWRAEGRQKSWQVNREGSCRRECRDEMVCLGDGSLFMWLENKMCAQTLQQKRLEKRAWIRTSRGTLGVIPQLRQSHEEASWRWTSRSGAPHHRPSPFHHEACSNTLNPGPPRPGCVVVKRLTEWLEKKGAA